MLKLICSAASQGRQSQEMSLLRRLVYHGRIIIKHWQNLGGGCKSDFPRAKLLKIEYNPKPSGGFVNAQATARGAAEASQASSSSSTLQWFGQRVHAHVRRIFLNNVLNNVKTNEQVRQRTIQRLLYGDSRPFFALVGLSLAGGTGAFTQPNELEGLCWEIRESLAKKQRQASSSTSTITNENETGTTGRKLSVSQLCFGTLMQQGCNGAVYKADWMNNFTGNWPLAVKMMFNYDFESNASTIVRGMVKELVPARVIDLKHFDGLEKGLFGNVKRCPPHPNIIEISHAFVDQIPLLPEGLENYPSALPRRLNPNDGLGRNMSLFLVMKRYDDNLQNFLRTHENLKFKTRLRIFTQLLDGVAHLEKIGIAHRDLKTDNVLLDLSHGSDNPQVVITDFGCCLSDKTNGLSLPFRTHDTDRGGNSSLMAPEVKTAVPGTWKWINYEKADAWALGAISYEIFGGTNPFYRNNNSQERPLDSATFTESDLPPFADDLAMPLRHLILGLLNRNPNERMSAEESSNICYVHCFAPAAWLNGSVKPTDSEIMQWLITLTTKVLCHRMDEPECKLIHNFLRRVKFFNVRSAIDWIQNHVK